MNQHHEQLEVGVSSHAEHPERTTKRGQDELAAADAMGELDVGPVSPRIYVASVADINAGIAHGAWIDAAADPEDLRLQIETMLLDSPTTALSSETASDWAIHDYDGFGVVPISEHADLETLSRLGRGIETHGAAFSAWADVNDRDPESWDLFAEAYLGEAADLNAYGEQLWDELGWQSAIESVLPAEVARHAHLMARAIANDSWMNGGLQIVHRPGGGIWVFRGDI